MRTVAWLMSVLQIAVSSVAMAQGFGAQKAVAIVIPFAPGGSTDIEGRLYAHSLTESLGRQFVVDNRAGRGGAIGAGYVAKSAPDGNTLLATTGSIATAPALYKGLPFDPIKDFAPVSLMSKRTSVLLVHPSIPVKTAAEFIAYARANPGKINFATSGAGGAPHLAAEWLHSATHTKVTFVHYKGAGPMLLDLVAGRLHATILTPLSSVPYIKKGELLALAVTTNVRSPLFPNLPTLVEQGVAGYDFSSWLGFFAPAATPPATVARISSDLVMVAKKPDIAKRLVDDGGVMVGSTPEELRLIVTREVERWRRVVQEAGISAIDE